MRKDDNLKRRSSDPKYLESIRRGFNHLYNEFGEVTAENAMKLIKFNNSAWNSLGISVKYQFNNKIEIH